MFPSEIPAQISDWPKSVILLFSNFLKMKEASQSQNPHNYRCPHTTQVPGLSHNPTLHLPFSASPNPLQADLSHRSVTHARVTITTTSSNGVLAAGSPVSEPLQYPIQGMLSRATSDYLSQLGLMCKQFIWKVTPVRRSEKGLRRLKLGGSTSQHEGALSTQSVLDLLRNV